jgi:PilZ domain
MPEEVEKQYAEKRRSRRAKIARMLRVRPSGPKDDHFEEVSINASQEGVLFKTRRTAYYPGMRVFVTFPYSSAHDPMNCEYVAKVVRIDKMPNDRFGVAVELLMTVNYSGTGPGSPVRS